MTVTRQEFYVFLNLIPFLVEWFATTHLEILLSCKWNSRICQNQFVKISSKKSGKTRYILLILCCCICWIICSAILKGLFQYLCIISEAQTCLINAQQLTVDVLSVLFWSHIYSLLCIALFQSLHHRLKQKLTLWLFNFEVNQSW